MIVYMCNIYTCQGKDAVDLTGYLLLVALLVAGDQLIKLWAQEVLKPLASIDLLPGILSLTYHENFGAAWGILQGQRWLLLAVTGVVIAGLLAALVMRMLKGKLLNLSVALIVAGGLGNLLDRAFHAGGFVVDYIYFSLIDFPIFNLADSCVCVGTFLLAFYILFLEGKETPSSDATAETAAGTDATSDSANGTDRTGDASVDTDESAGTDNSDAPQPSWEG